MSDDDDDDLIIEDPWSWPDNLADDSTCGEHCYHLTLFIKGKVKRIREQHCNCPWCHGEDEGGETP